MEFINPIKEARKKNEEFDGFMEEYEAELRKEFRDNFECLDDDIENTYSKEWDKFCNDEFIEYISIIHFKYI